jgi:hypothetical protein
MLLPNSIAERGMDRLFIVTMVVRVAAQGHVLHRARVVPVTVRLPLLLSAPMPEVGPVPVTVAAVVKMT